MKWSDLSAVVGKAAPILGTLVGGPAGAAVGALISSALGVENEPSAVQAALKTSPDAAVKLAQIEKDRAVELQQLVVTAENNRLSAETSQIESINATMRAEASSNHWPSYSWRPFCGFVFGTTFFGVYFVLPLLKIPVPLVPFEAWAALGAILGVASWFRGKAQADPANPIPADKG